MVDHSRPKASANPEDFNKASGASTLNKAQLLALVKKSLPAPNASKEYTTFFGEVLVPTENQRAILSAAEKRDVVMIDGPVGSGKTIWACYMGLKGLAEKRYRSISITAPAQTADEDHGFLPGEIDNKMLPYINQILESIDDWVGRETREQMQNAGLINIEPHAYIRGRTMKDTFFILDESQNATGKNLMTALGRLGRGSTFVFMGDDLQNDRTDCTSPYVEFMNRFRDYDQYIDRTSEKGFGFVKLIASDVRRHSLLKLIVERGDHVPLADRRHRPSSSTQPAVGAPIGQLDR